MPSYNHTFRSSWSRYISQTTFPLTVGIEKYVESIEVQVLPHGICKVIPPDGWWKAPNYLELIRDS